MPNMNYDTGECLTGEFDEEVEETEEYDDYEEEDNGNSPFNMMW